MGTFQQYYDSAEKKQESKNYQEAIKDYDQSLRLDPYNSSALNFRGVCKAQLGLHNDAVMDYDKAIEIDPTKYGMYFNRAKSNAKLKFYKDAINDYSTAINLATPVMDNNNLINRLLLATFFNGRGCCKHRLYMPEAAMNDFIKAIEIVPDQYNHEAIINLRNCLNDVIDNLKPYRSDKDLEICKATD